MSKTVGNHLALPRPTRRSRPVTIKLKGIRSDVATFGSPDGKEDLWKHRLKAAFGTASDAFVEMSLHQLQAAARLPGEGPSELAMNAAIAMISADKPGNEMDAALSVQGAALHMVAMAVMARIGGAAGGPHRLPGLASATAKLIRAYCTTVETRRRLRSGGEQNIRVEHVHVHDGGQAIVGAVNSRALDR
jgi:hypothetical protein